MIVADKRSIDTVYVPGADDDEHARAVVDTLLDISRKAEDEEVLTEQVVTAATKTTSPLHSLIFHESRDSAAYERRLYLARRLIRQVRVTFVEDETHTPTPLLVHVNFSDYEDEAVDNRYLPVGNVLEDPAAIANILEYRVGQVRAHYEYVSSLGSKPLLKKFVQQARSVLN